MPPSEQTIHTYPGWDEYKSRPLAERLGALERGGRIYDLLYAQQIRKEFAESVCEVADRIRGIGKTKEGMDFLGKLLSDKRAMLFFSQPSTRTFLSFLNACQLLGMRVSEIRDPSVSSEVKGESSEDSLRTFSSYVDLIVMRHHEEGLAEKGSWLLNRTKRPVPIINGGSGKDEHPTQALLDLYTIRRAFRKRGTGFEGKVVTFVGDLKRGRTVRSLSQLLAHYPGVKIRFVTPQAFQLREDIQTYLKSRGIDFALGEDFEDAIRETDVLYMTRIQDEHDKEGESRLVDTSKYHLELRHLDQMKPQAIIMHPFPRRYEIDVRVDNDPRASYWKQERNGMWIRAALMLHIFGREDRLA